MTEVIKYVKPKRNWKKTWLIIGICFIIILSIIAAFYLAKALKNARILKKEKDKLTTAPGNTAPGNTGSGNTGPGTTGTGTVTPPPSTTETPFNKLKVGDKLWAVGQTQLYTSPALGAANLVLTCPPGGYVGQVTQVTSGGTLKVKLYSYGGANVGYDFYAPAKSYIVK